MQKLMFSRLGERHRREYSKKRDDENMILKGFYHKYLQKTWEKEDEKWMQ